MTDILSGKELSDKIRHICGGKNVSCAVAFWGVGIRETLFGAEMPDDVRIICDISMQSTTQQALRELGAPKNRNLTVRDRLHAKIYISDRGAIVGSANASANGVGLINGEGGRLFEVGAFFSAGSKAYDEVQEQFDCLWDPKTWVNKKVLAQAAIVSFEPKPKLQDRELEKLSLLERIKETPERYRGVTFAIADSELTPDDAGERIAEANASDEFATPISYKNAVVMDVDDQAAIENITSLILLIYKPAKGRGTVSGYVQARPFPFEAPDIVFGKESWKSFTNAVQQPTLRRRLSKLEWALLGKLAQRDKWIYTVEEFVAALTEVEEHE